MLLGQACVVVICSKSCSLLWLGQNREVRKALAHVRLVVKRLIRVQYGPYRLADLPSGAVLEVRAKPLEKKQYRKREGDKKR